MKTGIQVSVRVRVKWGQVLQSNIKGFFEMGSGLAIEHQGFFGAGLGLRTDVAGGRGPVEAL
ncbi:MAG: hypothetical protein ABL983_24005 [Nitrospira sp.]